MSLFSPLFFYFFFMSRPWTAEEEKRLIEEANKIYDCVGFFNWRKGISLLLINIDWYLNRSLILNQSHAT